MKKTAQTGRILEEVKAERHRQDKKWGVQDHRLTVWVTILGEEFGEASRAALEVYFAHRKRPQKRTWLERLRMELIQVAAVAVAIVEHLDRNQLKRKGETHGH